MKDTASELIALNERIRSGVIFLGNYTGNNDSEYLYLNIDHFGFSRADVMILTVCPDGDNTIIGQFLTRDGKFYYFDFDLDDFEHSILRESDIRHNNRPSSNVIEVAARWFKDC